jgi:hypothetical protein
MLLITKIEPTYVNKYSVYAYSQWPELDQIQQDDFHSHPILTTSEHTSITRIEQATGLSEANLKCWAVSMETK